MTTATELVFVIPGAPSPLLNPNFKPSCREQRKARNKEKQSLQDTAYYAAYNALDHRDRDWLGKWPIDVCITIGWDEIRWPHDSRPDHDNCLASLKAGIDGIAAAMRVNDRRFRYFPLEYQRDERGVGWIEIRLTRGGE